MEWLFGGSGGPAAAVDAPLTASRAKGSSAPSQADESQHKARGNELFRRQEFQEAAREYSLGLARTPSATLFSNRSVCAAVQKQLAAAAMDGS